MPAQPRVLFVLTSHDKMGSTGKPTGWYLPEFAHPYQVLASHCAITIASPFGGESPLDPSSVDASKDDKLSVDFHKNSSHLWKNTEKLSSFSGKASDFDAVFFVGGHGPMFDLATDAVSHALINDFHARGKVISAVCHGPAALINVKLPNGKFLIDGQAVTGFSNVEEDQVGLTEAMPFSLENELNKSSGGKYQKAGDAWAPKVVVSESGKLITGQNPASAAGVGEAIKKAINA